MLPSGTVGTYSSHTVQNFTSRVPFNLQLLYLNFFALGFAGPIFLTLLLPMAPTSPSWGALPRRGKSSVPLARGRYSSPSVVLLSLSVAFLAEALLGVSLSVDFLGFFPLPLF